MRLVLVLILLLFPVADLYATLRFAQWTGVPAWVWLSISVMSGLLLLRNERMAFRGHVLAALHGEQPLLRGVVDSGRKVLAGLFFLLPGVVSDLIAVALLMLPINTGRRFEPQAAGAGRSSYGRRESLEGEFRRIE
jgi:UPF0716 protein FxsA